MKNSFSTDLRMAFMAIACVTFLAGCGNSANDSKNAPEAKVDRAVAAAPAVEQPESAEEEADELGPDGFEVIKADGMKTPVNVTPKGEKANIQDFAKAFCGLYPNYEPNQKMLKYLADPKAFDQETEVYTMHCNVPNGYISSTLWTEIDRHTTMCYWNRKNGHSLVGVYMNNGSENEVSDPAFLFYDYDPKTRVMTPDKEVYRVVEKEALNKDFEAFDLKLPEEGKDIVVNLYSDNGDDGYDITEKTLKWTGHDFKLVP